MVIRIVLLLVEFFLLLAIPCNPEDMPSHFKIEKNEIT
jgi:hypothetical protein